MREQHPGPLFTAVNALSSGTAAESGINFCFRLTFRHLKGTKSDGRVRLRVRSDDTVKCKYVRTIEYLTSSRIMEAM